MPRIPQGSFNARPSSRVGTPTVTTATGGGVEAAAEAAKNLTKAMATLQDQTERTEAYNKANSIHREYEQKKVQYETALKSVRPDGSFSYIDPLDDNPEMDKRRKVEGNINEAYQGLKRFYEKGQSEIGELTRSDIGNELLQQYVGDDLIKTRLRTNKEMIRQRGNEATKHFMKNQGLILNNILNDVSEGATSEVINLQIKKAKNFAMREIAQLQSMKSPEDIEKMKSLVDRQFAAAAGEIIKSKATQQSMDAADAMLGVISDPVTRDSAKRALERKKEAVVLSQNFTTMREAKSAMIQIRNMSHMDEATYQSVTQLATNVKNMYLNPKYSSMDREQVELAGADLMSLAVAKRTIQQNYDTNLEFLAERDIATDGPLTPEQASILHEVEKEVTASGLAKLMGASPEYKKAMDSMVRNKMADMFSDFRRNVPEVVAAENPHLQGEALFDKIQKVNEAQGFGDTPLAPKKSISKFQKDFESNLATNPKNASMHFMGTVMQGGTEYSRALAIDLVNTKDNLAFLVAAADVPPHEADRIIHDASKAKINKIDKGITTGNLKKAWKNLSKGDFAAFSKSRLYQGYVQAIWNRAAAEAEDVDDIPDEMEKAAKSFKDQYTIQHSGSGDSAVIAINGYDGVNYSTSEAKRNLSKGMTESIRLEEFSAAQRKYIIKNYIKSPKWNEFDDEGQKWILERSLTLKPSDRWKNKVEVWYGNKPVTYNEKGEVLEFTTKQIHDSGKRRDRQDFSELLESIDL